MPVDGMPDLVLMLIKLGIDRGSDAHVKRGVMECVEGVLKDISDDMVRDNCDQVSLVALLIIDESQLLATAERLAESSEPFAPRRMRVRIAQALGVVSPRARTLKRMFALRCLMDGAEETQTVGFSC